MQRYFPPVNHSKPAGPSLVRMKENISRILTSILAFDHLGTSTTMLKSVCKKKHHL